MNQELLSVGSKRRRTGGSLRGNASSSQVDEGQMNRVVEEDPQQQARHQEEEMDQESDDFDPSDDSSREDEHTHNSNVTNCSSVSDLPAHQLSSPFYTKTTKMKRKLDHGSEVRSFSLGKKPCKVSDYTSTTGLVPCSATPTTFGDLRAANGQGQQRRRITSVQPPTGLQEWLKMFQSWSGPEKLLALDELIDSCEPTQVKHMMQVIEPQFQRDFISLLPKELALYVLSFLEPKDLLQAAQTCRYWRILAEDNLLWREKCKEEGPSKHQSAVTCLQFNKNFVITSSDDGTVKLWDLKTGEFIRNLVTLESGGSGGVVWRIRASNTKLVCAVGSRNGTEETKLLVLDFDVDMK